MTDKTAKPEKVVKDEADTPTRGHNPRHDNKHKTKTYEPHRGGSVTKPKPTKAVAKKPDGGEENAS